MPGIFGIAALNPQAQPDRERLRRAFENMRACLNVRSDYACRTWGDPSGRFLFGSIGLPQLVPDKERALMGEADRVSLKYGIATSHEIERALYTHVDRPLIEQAPEVSNIPRPFSLAIADPAALTAAIATDRRASEPLYYTIDEGTLYFAPEVRAVQAAGVTGLDIRAPSIGTFLANGYLLSDSTFFTDVFRLPGGHTLVGDRGTWKSVQYWGYIPGRKGGEVPTRELVDMLGEAVAKAVRKDMDAPDTTAIFLSGGIDSRSILGGALEAVDNEGGRLRTVSWGIDDTTEGTDAWVARSLADTYGLQHTFLPRSSDDYADMLSELVALTGGMADLIAEHPQEYRLMREIEQAGFTRVLRGDEAFGWKGGMVTNSEMAMCVAGLRRPSAATQIENIVRPEVYADYVQSAEADFEHVRRQLDQFPPNKAKDYVYFTQRLQRYLGVAAYYKQIPLDHRNPLINDEILDFMAYVPDSSRRHKKLFIASQEKRYPDLMAYPMDSVYGLEDWRVELNPGRPFRAYVDQELADSASPIWEIFDAAAMRSLTESLVGTVYIPNPRSAAGIKREVRRVIRDGLSRAIPRMADYIAGRLALGHEPANMSILMRFLVLKRWRDSVGE